MEVATRSLVAVRRVRPAPADARLRGGNIDVPAEGDAGDLHTLRVSGWALGASARVARVEVVSRGRVVHAQRPALPRKDLVAAHGAGLQGERPGFDLLVGLLGLPEAFELSVRAVLADGSTCSLGTVSGTREPLRTPASSLAPLMVTSLGRTGTTWLMAMLAEHPEVVVFRRHPYEMRAAQYWAHALHVLSAPADHELSADPDFQRHLHWLGHNPYHTAGVARSPELRSWLGRTQVEALGRLAKGAIDEWYGRVATSQGEAGAVLFAEKHSPTHVPPLLWELYPQAREVFLVRDFRDMVSSILAFDRKRGYASFGRRDGEPDDAYARRLGSHARTLLAAWHERRDRAHLVRYEDLVRDPRPTLARLLEYAGIVSSPGTVAAMARATKSDRGARRQHATARDPEDSVGRWRREDPALRAVLDETFAETLEAFGHPATKKEAPCARTS